MMLTSLGEYFLAMVLSGWVLHGSSLHSGSVQLLSRNISQGSVATRLRCGGMFNYCLARNLLLSLSVKEFWKLVRIWQSYRTKDSGTFFPDMVYACLSNCSIVTAT